MSLEIKTKQILDNFEDFSSSDILDTLNQIQMTFQSKITQEYLQGKIKSISETLNEDDKKTLCKNLKPYFDWYIQGL